MATKESNSVLADDQRDQRDKLVEMLTKAYWMEIETVMNYIACSVNPDGVRAQEIIRSLAEDVNEELGHAQQFARRIKQLYGVVPGSRASPPSRPISSRPSARPILSTRQGSDPGRDRSDRLLQRDRRLHRRPRPVTNDMVIAILADEEGHRRLFEGFLREYQADGLAD